METRRALDYKGIARRRKILGGDYLFPAWRATAHCTLPILFLGSQAMTSILRAESADIV